jgi:hypothetical protein
LILHFYFARDARHFVSDSSQTVVPNIAGHPIRLIDAFFYNVCELLSGTIENNVTTRELFQLDAIHVDLLMESTESDIQERRNNLKDSLEVLTILMSWPQNVTNVRHNHGESLCKFVLECIEQFARYLQGQLSTDKDNVENVVYLMTILVAFIRLSSATMMWTPCEFGDFLPTQPWTAADAQYIIGLRLPDTGGNPVVIGSLAHTKSNSLLPLMTTNSVFNPLRQECRGVWLESGLLLKLGLVWNAVTTIDEISSKDLLTSMRMRLAYIIQSEILYLIASLFVQSPDVISAFHLSLEWLQLRPAFDNLLRIAEIHDAVETALRIRIQLLILRISASLLSHEESHKNLLLPEQIAALLIFYQTKYQDVSSAHNWINLNSYQTLMNFHYSSKVGHIDQHHDLWPWKHDKLLSASTVVNISSDFHLIQKDVGVMLSESVRKQPCYLLWDSVVCELLGSHALSTARPSVNQGGKISKSKLQHIFYIFYLVFQDKLFVDPSYNPDQCLTLPLGQLKFVDFISQLFKAAAPEDIFSVMDEFDVFTMLLGEKFLGAQSLSLTTFSDVFATIVKTELPDGQTRLFVHGLKPQFEGMVGWLLLQNSVLDYFHGLVIYSIYFQTSEADVNSFLGHEEIMLMLARKLIMQTRSLQSMHLVYQVSKLVMALTDIVLSMSSASFCLPFKMEIVSHLFETVETISRYRVFNASTNQISNDQDLYILQSSCNSATELLIHLLTTSVGDVRDWLDIFLMDDQYRAVDLSVELSKSSSIMRRPSSSMKINSPESGRNDEKNGKLRSSIAALLTMLVDEKLYLASLQISHAILVACARETLAIDQVEDVTEGMRRRKQNLRSLAAEVIGAILMFVAVSHKHTNIKVGVSLTLASLNSLTMLLRDERYVALRLTFQEFIRRENLLYEMLRAFARCLNGFDLMKQRSDAVAFVEIDSLSTQVMRAGLTTLIATVSGNDACKNVLSLLLQANREKVGGGRAKPLSSIESGRSSGSMKSASGLSSLVLCGERSPSRETIVVLLDLLLDDPHAGLYCVAEGMVNPLFNNDDDRPKIRNVAVLPDYFHLIPQCQESVQLFALESFKNLVSGRASLINQNVCSISRPKVLDIALDLLPFLPDSAQSSDAELIELLGRHSISVASLKHLFRTLQQKEGLKHPYSWKIVQVSELLFLNFIVQLLIFRR